MKIPRDLGGPELAAGLCRHWKYQQVHQVGSHIILETEVPNHQRIAIPAHPILKIGTLGSILRAVASHKGVSREAILKPLL
jgi:predicted RNA binding protein YcfA (HicA-like mRNA interferase family)